MTNILRSLSIAAIALSSTGCIATSALALDNDPIQACRSVDNDKERLACFDATAGEATVSSEPASTASSIDALSVGDGYVPTRRWEFSSQGTFGVARVFTQSGRNVFALTCVQGGQGISSELDAIGGWRAGVPALIYVDGSEFETRIIGGGDVVGFAMVPDRLVVSGEFLEAMTRGNYFAIAGPATADMPAGDVVFSLAGSSAAIGSLRSHCRM